MVTKRVRKPRILFWVLADTTKKRTNYFRKWTGIGSQGTWSVGEAARFKTKREAMLSPAGSFVLMFYEPTPIRKGTWGEELVR